MKEIILSQGKVTIVDDDDYAWLSEFSWFFHWKGYAIRNKLLESGKRTTVRMHREILRPPAGLEIDHINLDKLDNRRCNLRIATGAQNRCNERKRMMVGGVPTTSKFKGVHFKRSRRKWEAYVKINRHRIFLGYFENEIEAALAYNKAAIERFGEYARLNVIEERRR